MHHRLRIEDGTQLLRHDVQPALARTPRRVLHRAKAVKSISQTVVQLS